MNGGVWLCKYIVVFENSSFTSVVCWKIQVRIFLYLFANVWWHLLCCYRVGDEEEGAVGVIHLKLLLWMKNLEKICV